MDTSLQTEISVEQIVADFGAYYKNEGQGVQNLRMLPFESFGTRDAFTIVPTNDTILREENVTVTEILQQYQDDFTPKGSVGFEPVQIPLYKFKIDQEFNPHKLQASYNAFLTNTNSDVTTWPFIVWFIEKYIKAQMYDDAEMKAIYGGVYQAPVPGEPGEASKTMNGINKLMNDQVTAGKLVEIETGALSTDPGTFVDQIEDFIDGIPEKYRSLEMDLNMNRTLLKRMKRGNRKNYNMNYEQVVNRVEVVDQENIMGVGRASHMGSSRIWCTPKYNALFGVKGFENFQVEKAKRKVAIYTEWWWGAGFVQPKLIFTNGE